MHQIYTAHLIEFHLELLEWGTRGAQVVQHLAHHIKVGCLLRLLGPGDGLIIQVSKSVMTILWPALLLGRILKHLRVQGYALSAVQTLIVACEIAWKPCHGSALSQSKACMAEHSMLIGKGLDRSTCLVGSCQGILLSKLMKILLSLGKDAL